MSFCGQCPRGTKWCGACYEVTRGRRSKQSATAYVPDVAVEEREPVPAPAAPRHVPNTRGPQENWRHTYPRLWAHLTHTTREDGERRLTSTLLVFTEGGTLKLCLHDRDMNLVTFLTVGGFPEGLAQLEDGLARGTLSWRRKKPMR